MPGDLPCVSYMALYLVSMHIINTNSRTSTHWRLNSENGKVQVAVAAGGNSHTVGEGDSEPSTEDPLMSILTSRITLENGEWKLEAEPDSISESCNSQCAEKCKAKAKTVNCCKQHTSDCSSCTSKSCSRNENRKVDESR